MLVVCDWKKNFVGDKGKQGRGRIMSRGILGEKGAGGWKDGRLNYTILGTTDIVQLQADTFLPTASVLCLCRKKTTYTSSEFTKPMILFHCWPCHRGNLHKETHSTVEDLSQWDCGAFQPTKTTVWNTHTHTHTRQRPLLLNVPNSFTPPIPQF